MIELPTRTRIALEPTGLQDWLRQLTRFGFTLHLTDRGPRLRHRSGPHGSPPAVLLDFAKHNREAIIAFLKGEPWWSDENDETRCNECRAYVSMDLDDQPATCLSQWCPFRAGGDR
jgi:hypothetical protein